LALVAFGLWGPVDMLKLIPSVVPYRLKPS
jgi:hypothetical protein